VEEEKRQREFRVSHYINMILLRVRRGVALKYFELQSKEAE